MMLIQVIQNKKRESQIKLFNYMTNRSSGAIKPGTIQKNSKTWAPNITEVYLLLKP